MKKRVVFGLILYGLGSLLFSELSLGQTTYASNELRNMVKVERRANEDSGSGATFWLYGIPTAE